MLAIEWTRLENMHSVLGGCGTPGGIILGVGCISVFVLVVGIMHKFLAKFLFPCNTNLL